MKILIAEHLFKYFRKGQETIKVLNDVSLSINQNEITIIVGASGAGKSTLLHILSGLDKPDSGEVIIDAKNIFEFLENEVSKFRNTSIGFIYQFHHLLPEFDAVDNVAMPLIIGGAKRAAARDTGVRLLERMGLGHRLDHRPGQLSGGEQQRVAIARALANKPAVVLADEPTGNLDPHTSESVFNALLDLVRGEGVAALVATHNLELTRFMDRVVALKEGHLEERAKV